MEIQSREMTAALARPPAKAQVRRARLSTQRRLLVGGLLACDIAALLLAAVLAYTLRFRLPLGLFRDVQLPVNMYLTMVPVMVVLWLVLFALMGLYAEHNLLGGTREYAMVFNACTIAALVVVLGAFLSESWIVSRGLLSVTWLTSFLVVGAARFWYRRLIYRLRQGGFFLRPTLVVGADAEGVALASQLAHSGASGMAVLGFVDNTHPVGSRVAEHWPVLGRLEDLEALIEHEGVAQLVVATGAVPRERLLGIVSTYGPARHVDIHFSSGLFEVLTTGIQVQERAYVPLISLNKTRLSSIDILLKTVLDLVVTIPGLLVLLPFFLVIGVAIKIDSPGPIIYRRRVLGLNGKEFNAYKFRTMRTDWERTIQDEQVQQQFVVGQKPKDDPRVTHVGRVLRRYSLDELPQLVNVLKREMSLVGPRMITQEEARFYRQWLMNLLTIRPGITGLWQVSGRAETSYEDKVRLDMTYIRNYTIWLDLQLLFQTIPVTLRSRGAF